MAVRGSKTSKLYLTPGLTWPNHHQTWCNQRNMGQDGPIQIVSDDRRGYNNKQKMLNFQLMDCYISWPLSPTVMKYCRQLSPYVEHMFLGNPEPVTKWRLDVQIIPINVSWQMVGPTWVNHHQTWCRLLKLPIPSLDSQTHRLTRKHSQAFGLSQCPKAGRVLSLTCLWKENTNDEKIH